jgi:aminoglycoside phosphotransferase family enzyme
VEETPGHASTDPVGTAEKLAFLLHRAWPDDQPELVETHMSWVFLTRDRAYKMKRPVHLPPLDYRTLEDRRVDCEAEVRLNEPLAPGVYLGTTPLVRGPGGDLRIGAVPDGEVVDWLVVMRRLPHDAMLDARIERHDVDPAGVSALVRHLCAFYRDAPRHPVDDAAHRASLEAQAATDLTGLLDPRFGLDRRRISAVGDRIRATIATSPGLRARGAEVREGHGDLRPEHVLLLDARPLVIDRLSFDLRLRLVDPLFDLALLAVECAHLGDPSLGDRIADEYRRTAPDDPPASVDHLYRGIRALTRARLSIGHLRDGTADADRWHRRTASYLDIAERHGDLAARHRPA